VKVCRRVLLLGVVAWLWLAVPVAAATVQWQIHLQAGRNFISLPGALQERRLPQLLAPILPEVKSVAFYDAASASWQTFIAGLGDEQSLWNIPVQRGFYVTVGDALDWTLVGEATLPVLNTLSVGWNPLGPDVDVRADALAQNWELNAASAPEVWRRNEHGEQVR